MERLTIQVNDIEISSTNSDEDNVSLSQLLMDSSTSKIWFQSRSFKQRMSLILCFIGYLFLAASFLIIYISLLINMTSEDGKKVAKQDSILIGIETESGNKFA